MFDIIILGGGPAGCSAAIYAGRKKMKVCLITESFGGQSIVSDSIGNWLGDIEVNGIDLAKRFEAHVRSFPELTVKMGRADSLTKLKIGFSIKVGKERFTAKTVLITTGGRRRHLGVPGEEKLNGRGVAYCSTCDAPLFRDKEVAVIGVGNAGLEAIIDLFSYAARIYLLNRGQDFSGDPATVEQVKKNKKVEIIYNAETVEILGDTLVSGIKYKDLLSEDIKDLAVQGIFVEIGSVPNSEIVKGIAKLDKRGHIKINHQTGETSVPGLYAAGDVSDELYQQNLIAAGNAVSAVLSAYKYLLDLKKK